MSSERGREGGREGRKERELSSCKVKCRGGGGA